MKHTFLLLFILITGFSFNAQAQRERRELNYKTAFGVRYQPFGFSAKFNNSYKNRSFELVGYLKDGFVAGAYYYWNIDLNKKHTMQFYFGGGGQAGKLNEENGGDALFGVGGIIGLDYKFKKLPINLSFDWQPSYQIAGDDEQFQGEWGGIAVRFAF
jgi:hypothetical protein